MKDDIQPGSLCRYTDSNVSLQLRIVQNQSNNRVIKYAGEVVALEGSYGSDHAPQVGKPFGCMAARRLTSRPGVRLELISLAQSPPKKLELISL